MERSDLHDYQEVAIDFALANRKCALFLDLGLGKTVSTLTIISELYEVERVLIIAPKRVVQTVWKQESKKWDHLDSLDIGICSGTAEERKRTIFNHHHITLISRDNLVWLNKLLPNWPYSMVVIDESSSFKAQGTQRFKAIKKRLGHISHMVLLSGTPTPNGYLDLWSQMYLLDGGKRLCKTMTQYKSKYFDVDYSGFKWTLKDGAEKKILEAVSDICLSMSAKDHIGEIDTVYSNVDVILTNKERAQYKELTDEYVLELEEDTIVVDNAAILGNKLLQLANGNMYTEDSVVNIHKHKLNALIEIVESTDENILLAYNFKSDLALILEQFPDAVVIGSDPSVVEKWNNGEIKLLVASPVSAGHGLNLQFGGSIIVWYGLNWSLELYQQFNARLKRQGQQNIVRIMHIVAEDTIDHKVLRVLKGKGATQDKLLEALK
jgi:SNF2 family DNA or RNA helicase